MQQSTAPMQKPQKRQFDPETNAPKWAEETRYRREKEKRWTRHDKRAA